MKFNRFVWELYKESERGKWALRRCANFADALHDGTFSDFLFGMSFDSEASGGDRPATDPYDAALIEAARSFAAQFQVKDLETASRAFDALVASGLSFAVPDGEEPVTLQPRDLAAEIQPISIGFHLAHPEHFIPYGFRTSFADLQRIGEMFNLALPPVPGKRDVKERGRYYGQLNGAFHEFRRSYELSAEEMCAFLHDFAPRFLEEDDNTLPEPSKVWLVTCGTGGNGDFEFLEKAVEDEDAIDFWQGNLDTRRGDVLLMYCVSPYSYIHSIWRAITDGFVDPFFHYHSTVWIGHPAKTVSVTFKEMKAHPLLSQKGAIKAHLQGPSGKPFTLEEYEAILGIMAAKGQDVSKLPKPRAVSFLPFTELVSERDVETELVEPLLLRLGYAPGDWLRQMPLRMGRGERVYPDYVFGAKTARGEERAEMVLEAKFSIGSERELREAYLQAVSYAYRLRAKRAVLASREGLWVFTQKRGSFGLEHVTHYTWDALQHPDALHMLRRRLAD